MARGGERDRGNQASINSLVELIPDVRRRPAFIARETPAALVGLRTANGKRTQGQKGTQVLTSHSFTVVANKQNLETSGLGKQTEVAPQKEGVPRTGLLLTPIWNCTSSSYQCTRI